MIRLLALLSLLPMTAQATVWDEFRARCLTPYEAIFPPILDGLERIEAHADTPTYVLLEGGTLVIDLVPDDGLSACTLVDPSGQSEQAFDQWISDAVSTQRYVEMGGNVWHSFQWVEPVLAVSKRREGTGVILQVLETDLES